jgi:hypothetical protein
MPELQETLGATLASRYFYNLMRIGELARPLNSQQFWSKPYPYGNSFGHLVLHLTGNLNYYIGAQSRAPDTSATASVNLPSRIPLQRKRHFKACMKQSRWRSQP